MLLSVASDSMTPWPTACRALLSMESFRQEYWSGLPCLPPGNLPDPGIEPGSLTPLPWQAELYRYCHLGSHPTVFFCSFLLFPPITLIKGSLTQALFHSASFRSCGKTVSLIFQRVSRRGNAEGLRSRIELAWEEKNLLLRMKRRSFPGPKLGNPLLTHGWRSLAVYSPWSCKESD